MNSKSISDKAVNYIENNMDRKINLDGLSEIMHYSKFHFHRLFLNEMGISVIDYIRRRRIAYSSNILRMTELSVTTIAMRNGFGSVDTFIKNFKSYYGITPGKYRMHIRNSKEKNEKETTYKMMNLYEQIRNCSKREKNNAIFMLDRMIELSKFAHHNGLLSLEDELREDDFKILKKSIELLLKGTDYMELENILTNYIMSSDLSNYELLLRVLIIKGVLLLHEGTYPWDVRIRLSSYFGEDFIEVLDGKYNDLSALSEFYDAEVLKVDNSKLVKEIAIMNKRVLQRVFRECDIIIIAISLMGMEKSIKETVINSLSLGQKSILLEVINSLDGINVKHIFDANSEIVSLLQQLRLSKDIE